MLKKIFRSTLDDYLFFFVILLGLLFATHGKSISDALFNGHPYWLRDINVLPHLLCILVAAIIQYIRGKKWRLQVSMAVTPLLCLIAVFLVHITSNGPSILVFTVQLMLLGVACGVIALEPFLQRKDLTQEFWKIFMDSAMKAIRYVLMLYIAGFALLKFLSDGIGESRDGFLTSFIYPTVMVVYCLFIVGYWLAIPGWENLVRSHTVSSIRKS